MIAISGNVENYKCEFFLKQKSEATYLKLIRSVPESSRRLFGRRATEYADNILIESIILNCFNLNASRFLF